MHSLVAHSGLHRTILYVAIVIWAAPEWVGSFFQRSKEGAAHHDSGSLALLMVSFTVGIVGAFVFVNIVPEATLDWHEPRSASERKAEIEMLTLRSGREVRPLVAIDWKAPEQFVRSAALLGRAISPSTRNRRSRTTHWLLSI